MKRSACVLFSALFMCIMFCCSGCSTQKRALYNYNMKKYVAIDKSYKGITVDTNSEGFSTYLEGYMKKQISENGLLSPDRESGVEKGDLVNISYYATADSAEIDTAEKTCDITAGAKDFEIPDITDKVIGCIPGQQFTVSISTSQEFEIILNVTVNYVYRPVLTDSVAQALGSDSAGNYKTDILPSAIKAYLLDKVLNDAVIKKYPSAEYELYYSKLNDYYTTYAGNYNLSLKDYLKTKGLSESDYESMIDEKVKSQMSNEMILYAIADREKLEVTDHMLADTSSALIDAANLEKDTFKEQITSGEIEFQCIKTMVSDYLYKYSKTNSSSGISK